MLWCARGWGGIGAGGSDSRVKWGQTASECVSGTCAMGSCGLWPQWMHAEMPLLSAKDSREVAARQALLRLAYSGHDSCNQSSRLQLQVSLSLLSFPRVLAALALASAVFSAFHVAPSVFKLRQIFLHIHFCLRGAVLVSRIEQDAHKDSAIGAAVVLCAAGPRRRRLLQGMERMLHWLMSSPLPLDSRNH